MHTVRNVWESCVFSVARVPGNLQNIVPTQVCFWMKYSTLSYWYGSHNSNGWNSKALKLTNLLLGYCSISRCQDHPATQDSERAIISMQESSLYQEDPVTQKNKHDIDSKLGSSLHQEDHNIILDRNGIYFRSRNSGTKRAIIIEEVTQLTMLRHHQCARPTSVCTSKRPCNPWHQARRNQYA